MTFSVTLIAGTSMKCWWMMPRIASMAPGARPGSGTAAGVVLGGLHLQRARGELLLDPVDLGRDGGRDVGVELALRRVAQLAARRALGVIAEGDVRALEAAGEQLGHGSGVDLGPLLVDVGEDALGRDLRVTERAADRPHALFLHRLHEPRVAGVELAAHDVGAAADQGERRLLRGGWIFHRLQIDDADLDVGSRAPGAEPEAPHARHHLRQPLEPGHRADLAALAHARGEGAREIRELLVGEIERDHVLALAARAGADDEERLLELRADALRRGEETAGVSDDRTEPAARVVLHRLDVIRGLDVLRVGDLHSLLFQLEQPAVAGGVPALVVDGAGQEHGDLAALRGHGTERPRGHDEHGGDGDDALEHDRPPRSRRLATARAVARSTPRRNWPKLRTSGRRRSGSAASALGRPDAIAERAGSRQTPGVKKE